MIFWLNNIQEFFIKIFDEKPTLQTYTWKGLAYTTLASKPTLEHVQTYTMKPTHLH